MFGHILLVEDNQNDIELTIAGIEETNIVHKIDVVRDGEEALDYLLKRGEYKERKSGNPIVILLDIKLPKLSGIEVLTEIKRDNFINTIPIVMLTSSREEKDLEACYRAGCNAYVVKPIGFEDFVKSIKSLSIFWALINEPPPVKIKQRSKGSVSLMG